jgi:hypothetical protein
MEQVHLIAIAVLIGASSSDWSVWWRREGGVERVEGGVTVDGKDRHGCSLREAQHGGRHCLIIHACANESLIGFNWIEVHQC